MSPPPSSGSIVPLPVFEADADPHHRNPDPEADAIAYEKLEAPKTIVVRFGSLKLIGEYPYGGDAKPGCGTKLVVRTHRGTELAEMLTTTCENAGCSKSITRKELLKYIENSGGRDYPFHTKGRVLRVATIEDLNKQSALQDTTEQVKKCRALIAEMDLPMKLVDVEPILGAELMTFYYTSDERIDFRELVRSLAAEFKTRIEMRQVGARDEARLTADYERCGQYCCCKGFLKVLKPVSMKSAKVQKATLDPLKISGRCGRLMCCLRYEDQTYKELKANLPHRKTRVGTPEGPGIVLDSKILVQLVLVKLDEDAREIAVPVEDLMDPDECPRPGEKPIEVDPLRGMPTEAVSAKLAEGETPPQRRKRRRRRGKKKTGAGDGGGGDRAARPSPPPRAEGPATGKPSGESKTGDGTSKKPRRRRRRGRRRGRGGGGGAEGSGPKAD